jgi:S-DNA-T family DNA segregation ATPase FtsK/SpoIIIE
MKKDFQKTVLDTSTGLVLTGGMISLLYKASAPIINLLDRLSPGSLNIQSDINNVAVSFALAGAAGLYYFWTTKSKFDLVFRELGLGTDTRYPIMKSKKKYSHSITYKFTLPPGLTTDDFIKKQIAIEQHIGKKINIEYINKGLFIIEEYTMNAIPFYDYEPIELKGNVPIVTGKDRKGNYICFDLAEGTEPHLLLAGSTGCGKTTAIHSIITNIILFTNVNLHLIDLKHGASFNVYKKSSHVKSFADTLEKAEKVLKSINEEIETRYQKMARNGFSDIQSYNKRHKSNPMTYELLVLDEMIDLTHRNDLLEQLEIISAKARGCGIHAIYSTQRPDKDVLNGRIKSNVTNVLGMRTKDSINSRIIIDTDGLEKLNGKGHGLFSRLGDITEIQTPYIDTAKVKTLISHTYISKIEPKAIPSEKIDIDVTDLEVLQK